MATKLGRKPKLTSELEKRLLGILSAGVPKKIACPAVGISDRTLRIWVERANAGEPRYVEFLDRLDEAIAGAKVGLVLALRSASKKDWRAAAFLLERTDHENFGQKIPLASSDELGKAGPVEVRITVAGDAVKSLTTDQVQDVPQD